MTKTIFEEMGARCCRNVTTCPRFLLIKEYLLRNDWKCFKIIKYIEKYKEVGRSSNKLSLFMKKWERIREISRKNRDSIDFVHTDIYNYE